MVGYTVESQPHLSNKACLGADPWHDDTLGIMTLEGPSVLDPIPQPVATVDVSPAPGAVDEDNNITLPSAPSNRTTSLGGHLNADGIVVLPPGGDTGVALHLNTLATKDHVVAIEESIRILTDPLGGGISLTHKSKQARFEFLTDLEAALAVLGVPI